MRLAMIRVLAFGAQVLSSPTHREVSWASLEGQADVEQVTKEHKRRFLASHGTCGEMARDVASSWNREILLPGD